MLFKDMKSLTNFAIDMSPEIQSWLSYFDDKHREILIYLLMHIKFVSYNEYSAWFDGLLATLRQRNKYALYAVRKTRNMECLWDGIGNIVERPGQSQGSEDFVYYLIKRACRRQNGLFIDHPSLNRLRKEKISNIILIDDSIGSGNRLITFFKKMFASRTFMSWWSYGKIRIYVFVYAANRDGINEIIKNTPGSNHGVRKIRKSAKLIFESKISYASDLMMRRWGDRYHEIIDLCNYYEEVPEESRLGFGGVMGNIIFYHSVPNNTPGLLFYRNNPLFSGRATDKWLINLLKSRPNIDEVGGAVGLPSHMVDVLKLIKSGMRNTVNIAGRMDCDIRSVTKIIDILVESGFLSRQNRLTKIGYDILYRNSKSLQNNHEDNLYDYSLYIPTSWCADRAGIQPSTRD